MRRFLLLVQCLFLGAVISGCDSGVDSPRGFSLPKGDAARGKEVFMQTGCLSCHVIDGVDSDIAIELKHPVKLGGEVPRVKTYAELVTSIINPSHKIARRLRAEDATADGKSVMRNYNDVLTVSQLIDLVTFLETQYKLAPYKQTPYGAYYP